jgi:PTS system nitrogen regulatory IIA component
MSISDVLSEDMILTEIVADSKRHLLEQISKFVAERKGLDKSSVFEAVLERENLGSTGYGNGVAFPHARLEGLKNVVDVFARLKNPIDYDALDGNPVDMVAFMISPENSGDDHLRTLAIFSRVLKDAAICRAIRSAKNAHEIYSVMQK